MINALIECAVLLQTPVMTSYWQPWSLSKREEKMGPESVGRRDGNRECARKQNLNPILDSYTKVRISASDTYQRTCPSLWLCPNELPPN